MALVKLNNRGVRNVSAFGSVGVGSMVFIKKLTASSSSTLSFVHGTSSVVLDSTYKKYIFYFKSIHPATNQAEFSFNGSIDAGSNYNVTKTTTVWTAEHREDGSGGAFSYYDDKDLAQGTGFQALARETGDDNDLAASGYLCLFNPSSTTFVKHFIARTNTTYSGASGDDYTQDMYTAGYFNTTSDIDAVQFKMSSGNIAVGDICLYGIK